MIGENLNPETQTSHTWADIRHRGLHSLQSSDAVSPSAPCKYIDRGFSFTWESLEFRSNIYFRTLNSRLQPRKLKQECSIIIISYH